MHVVSTDVETNLAENNYYTYYEIMEVASQIISLC